MKRLVLPSVAALLVMAVVAGRSLHAGAEAPAPPASPDAYQERADHFLAVVNPCYKDLYTIRQKADWAAATDVTPEHEAASAEAGKMMAAFNGNRELIVEARALLEHAAELNEPTVLQLRQVLLNAAEGPMTNPELVAERVEAETAQASALNSFVFMLDGRPITVNEIDERLITEKDLGRRLAIWEASKQSGPALKPGLVHLQALRNGVARELGYNDYFTLQAAGHAMTTPEVLEMQEQFLETLRPLYLQIHTWAKYELAKKYGQPVPDRIPAHWLPNRWGQDWSGLIAMPELQAAFADHTAEWVMKTAEDFYKSIGRGPLPESFWVNSDLYPVPAGDPRKKNTHGSCWSIDLDHDIRSLMNVEPDEAWFGTAHHELGHGYYDLAYARPEVPPLLRTGASPAFHEAFASLGEFQARQLPYLESLGLITRDQEPDPLLSLMRAALSEIVFISFASGTMTHWEADYYANQMPPDQWNAHWWDYAARFQGIEPPEPRGEEYCDPATKTHVNDAPAYYFSYAIATVIQYQLHDYIAREILHQDPRRCNYAGNPEVGAFFERIQRLGATRDWRAILKEATGEDLSTRAMAEYYRPLIAWLEEQNRGRKIGWE